MKHNTLPYRTVRAMLALALFCLTAMPAVVQADEAADPVEQAAALQGAIDRAIANGDAQLTIEPGTYRIAPPRGHAPHLKIHGAKGLAIIADGVTLICTELNLAIDIQDSDGLTLQGVTIDYDPLPFTQGTVEAVSDDGERIDIRLDDGYPDTTERVNVYFWEPDGSRIKAESWTRYGKSLTPLSADDTMAGGFAGNRLVRLDQGRRFDDQIAPGDRVTMKTNIKTPHGIILTNCARTTLRDVTLYTSTCFGFLERFGHDNRYEACRITPGPMPEGASEPRLMSTIADGFHSKFASHGPTVVGCLFERMGDDGIAINGDFMLVYGADPTAAEPTVTLGFKRSLVLAVGDELIVRRRSDSNAIGTARVTAITEVAPGDGLPDSFDAQTEMRRLLPEMRERNAWHSVYRVTLDESIDAQPGDVAASPDRVGSHFVVKDNTIRNHRARGMLIRGSHGIIEGNSIDGSSMAGIVFGPNVELWMEGDFVSDVTVRNNTIRNVNRAANNPNSTYLGAISVTSPVPFAPGGHENIRIENNTIEGGKGPAIFIGSAADVKVWNNTIRGTHQLPGGHGENHGLPGDPVIYITGSDRVGLEGNTIADPGPFAGPEVRDDRTADESAEDTKPGV